MFLWRLYLVKFPALGKVTEKNKKAKRKQVKSAKDTSCPYIMSRSLFSLSCPLCRTQTISATPMGGYWGHMVHNMLCSPVATAQQDWAGANQNCAQTPCFSVLDSPFEIHGCCRILFLSQIRPISFFSFSPVIPIHEMERQSKTFGGKRGRSQTVPDITSHAQISLACRFSRSPVAHHHTTQAVLLDLFGW